jgi:CubicO group peptidase (beta-lactamase class C family)
MTLRSTLLRLAALALLLAGATDLMAAPTPGSVVSSLEDCLDALARNDDFCGTVLVAHGGSVALEKAYGLADRAQGSPNSLDTRFNIASMGKMFTGVAILQLVEQGKLSLSSRLSQVLPDYPNQEVARQVTIHELLTHTAGVADWMASPNYMDLRATLRSVADYVPLFVDQPLDFAPGSQYSYSNSGYILLGLVIERVSGEDYYDYVSKHIFAAAGMGSTGAFALDDLPPNTAVGYTQLNESIEWTDVWRDNVFVLPMRGASDGGGYSTLRDLYRFSQALLNDRLLSRSNTQLLLKGKVQAEEETRWYGYGFQDKVLNGQRVVGHGGGFPGVNSFLDMYIDAGYVVVVLTNRDNGAAVVREFLASHPLN